MLGKITAKPGKTTKVALGNGGRGLREGFTLLETMIAMSVLAIAVFGLLSAFNSVVRMREVQEQEVFAANAIREKLAEIRSDARAGSVDGFSDMIENYLTLDSYYTFFVERIDHGTMKSGTVVLHLVENSVPAVFGLPDTDGDGIGDDGLDLNGDGTIGSADLGAGSYDEIRLVPFEVRVPWRRAGGVQMVTKRHLLVARKSDG